MPTEKGTLSRLAEASARGAGIPLGEAIRRMRDELAALPEGWAPAGPTMGDRGTQQGGDVPVVAPVTGFPTPLRTAPRPISTSNRLALKPLSLTVIVE